MRKVLLVLLVLFAIPALASDQPGFSAWIVDSLIKVFPDTTSQPAGNYGTIYCARNGHTSVQIAFRSASEQRVTLKVVSPRRKKSSLSIKVYRVGYVEVKSHPKGTPPDELVRPELGEYPDPLYPLNGEFALHPERTESVWIEVFAASSADPGFYEGSVEVRAGKKRIVLPIRVEVVQASIPKQQKLWVTNWLWLDHDMLDKHYPLIKSHPDLYWSVIANIAATMAEYRQNVAFVPVRSLAKAQLVNGNIRYDFQEVDRWVEIFDKVGLARRIEGGHLSGRQGGGYDARYVLPTDLVEDGKIVQKELPADDPRAEANLRQFLRQLREHLKQKGRLDRYFQHVHDEPHGSEMPIYKRFASIVREEMPGTPIIDAISLKEDVGAVQQTTIWVPELSTFDDQLGTMQKHSEQGGQNWYYICLGPTGRYLNRFVDYPLLKVRLLPWLNFRYGLTGYLHWGGNFWTDDPIHDLQPNWGGDTYLPAGDDAIVYPDAAHDGAFPSIRLAMMREGIEDYELLSMAAESKPKEARALVNAVIPGFTDYVRDVVTFRRYQEELLKLAAQVR